MHIYLLNICRGAKIKSHILRTIYTIRRNSLLYALCILKHDLIVLNDSFRQYLLLCAVKRMYVNFDFFLFIKTTEFFT